MRCRRGCQGPLSRLTDQMLHLADLDRRRRYFTFDGDDSGSGQSRFERTREPETPSAAMCTGSARPSASRPRRSTNAYGNLAQSATDFDAVTTYAYGAGDRLQHHHSRPGCGCGSGLRMLSRGRFCPRAPGLTVASDGCTPPKRLLTHGHSQ